jgi:hypothetical protein
VGCLEEKLPQFLRGSESLFGLDRIPLGGGNEQRAFKTREHLGLNRPVSQHRKTGESFHWCGTPLVQRIYEIQSWRTAGQFKQESAVNQLSTKTKRFPSHFM